MITKEEYNLYKQQVESMRNSQKRLNSIGKPLTIIGAILAASYPVLLTIGIYSEASGLIILSVLNFIIGLPMLFAGIAISIVKNAVFNKRINNRLNKIKEFENQNVFENE